MTDAHRLAELVETWRHAIDSFVALARDIPLEQADLPTDLAGWSVRDNVAHTAHLESVVAGAPEETVSVEEAAHVKGLMGRYTEQGVVARRDRSLAALADEIESAAATRYAALLAEPPTDAGAPAARTPGGVPWSNERLLSNRPLDVWMHEQDIRRAIGRPGGYDAPAARHTIDVFGAALPMVVGKRVAPPVGTTVRVDVPEAGRTWTMRVGNDGRAALVDPVEQPTVRLTLRAEDFVVLAGGRRAVAATAPKVEGDTALADAVLANLAVTP
jgi:uncharacterized protein (TIGR03083 family)